MPPPPIIELAAPLGRLYKHRGRTLATELFLAGYLFVIMINNFVGTPLVFLFLNLEIVFPAYSHESLSLISARSLKIVRAVESTLNNAVDSTD